MSDVGVPNNGQAQLPPSLSVISQYVRDFSFESPRGPEANRGKPNPAINVNVNVGSKNRGNNEYEVELKLEAKASQGEETVFHTELNYVGIFRVSNVPSQSVHPFVMIECPRMLFPFARQAIADATVKGGFPPVLIDPIDFVGLYQKFLQRAKAQQEAAAAETPAPTQQ
jgi:preprotein translocase subunit SecB